MLRKTAFYNASKRMKTEIINSADGNNVTHLHLATKSNSKKITNLLSRRASIDDNGNNATSSCHITADTRELPPLHLAVGKGNKEITELPLWKHTNVNTKGRHGITSVHVATERGYLQIVKHLLKHVADVTSAHTSTTLHNYTILHLAVEKQYEQQISKLLLSKGANVNSKRTHDIPSLHLATQWWHLRMVKQLLKLGTNVDSLSLGVQTPLHFAIEYRHDKIVKLFLECSATINSKDVNDRTILHLAVKKVSSTIVEHILKHCSDLNRKATSAFLMLRCGARE